MTGIVRVLQLPSIAHSRQGYFGEHIVGAHQGSLACDDTKARSSWRYRLCLRDDAIRGTNHIVDEPSIWSRWSCGVSISTQARRS